MEIEVKLKLPDAAAHQQVARLLAPFRLATHLQENQRRAERRAGGSPPAVLRLRFYDGDSRCVVSLKGKAVIADGISRMDEEEEDVDSVLGRACIAEPWRLVGLECGIVKRVLAEYGCKGFVCLGGFRNVRGVFDWQGLKIELDETQYDFGTCYEIECESSDPERAKKVIEGFLVENGVPFTNSAKSKFAIFRSGKLPDEI
eukprot:PITA_01207